MYRHFFKRFLDFTFSLIGLVVISPILILVWVLLMVANGGAGAVFVQCRPGKGGKLFKVIKFKTMNDKRDGAGNLLPDGERITSVGRVVRSLSIDELPQLINVLKGDMSLVGPRPLLIEYLPLYSAKQARRHEVKPGMTGWAQVNGRNLVKLSKKFEYDVWYVDNISFLLDVKILFLTFVNVLRRKDVGKGSGDMKDVDDLDFAKRMVPNNILIQNRLLLRRPEASDKEQLFTLKNNKNASKLLGGYTPEYSLQDIVSWINFHRDARNEILFVIHDQFSNKLIGHVGLYNIDHISKKAEFGILIADDDSRGKGYGSLCLEQMIELAFNKLDLNKITLSYLKDNIPADTLYKKYGFEVEGVLKNDIFKNGQYYDVVLMAKFNDFKHY